MKSLVLGGATLFVLSAAHAALPGYLYFLPLGGSPIAETGIVLSMALAMDTIIDLIRKRPNG